MTERWRKRLRDLDGAGPSDEVFEGAKAGPSMPEEAIPRPGVGSRVVTAVAAFLVFGLAISVFAIPALRLGGGAGGSGTSMLLPLWPARTLDDLEALQARVDEGDASVAYTRGPASTAEEFGRQVMGWSDFEVLYEEAVFWAGNTTLATSSSSLDPIVVPGEENFGSPAMISAFGPSTSSTGAPSLFRTLELVDSSACTGMGFCDPNRVRVTTYQPLRGDGVWAVLSAESEDLDLDVSPGAQVTQGTSLMAILRYPNGDPANMGLHVGAGDCSIDLSPSSWISEGNASGEAEIRVDLPAREGTGCSESEPGYVYVAVFEEGTSNEDPFQAPASVVALEAVPVIVQWPSEEPVESNVVEPTETPSTDPSPEQTSGPSAWTTYSDPMGWTIDVPDAWITEAFNESGRVTFAGAHFASGDVTFMSGENTPITRVVPDPGEVMLFVWSEDGGPVIPPADDSSIPLQYDDLAPSPHGWSMSFRADGRPFSILVKSGEGDEQLSPEHEDILRRMIGSIAFEPWETGGYRDGFLSVGSPEEIGNAEVLEIPGDLRGWFLIVARSETGFTAFGPVGRCGSADPVLEPSAVTFACGDGTRASYDLAGRPHPGNPEGFRDALEERTVIRAWDGSLLVSILIGFG
jgi:hypothetical protein